MFRNLFKITAASFGTVSSLFLLKKFQKQERDVEHELNFLGEGNQNSTLESTSFFQNKPQVVFSQLAGPSNPQTITAPVPVPTPNIPVSVVPVPPVFTPVPVSSGILDLQKLDKEGIMKYGFPGINNVRFHDGYVLSFDYRTRNAYYACEHLTGELIENGVTREKSVFKEDESLPPLFRPKMSDYQGSGYDRGHLVPAADLKQSQKAMDDSFYLTNISPQVGSGFNRDYWARLESFARKLSRQYKSVYVCTGPLWLPRKEADGKYYIKYQVIGEPPNVAVPTHFYKVMLVENLETKEFMIGSFMVPNAPIPENTPIETFVVPLEAIERNSGLTFFNHVPRMSMSPLCTQTKCILPPPHPASKKPVGLLPPPPPTLQLPPPTQTK